MFAIPTSITDFTFGSEFPLASSLLFEGKVPEVPDHEFSKSLLL